MNFDLLLVLFLLASCVGLFVINKPRMDVVALLAMVALPLSGVISVNEALAGFSDPSVVLIAALFVISATCSALVASSGFLSSLSLTNLGNLKLIPLPFPSSSAL